MRIETKEEFGKYLLDVSKFVVAGAIIYKIFNYSGGSIVWAFVFALLFLLFGLIVVEKNK
jgi:hypothetical protein